MSQFMKKFCFFYVLFIACVFSVFSFAQSKAISERDKQLCDFKKAFIKINAYDYKAPYFYYKTSRDKMIVNSLISLQEPIYPKNSWELIGTQINTSPLVKEKSMVHWLKYDLNKTKKHFNKLCKTVKGSCIFKVVYEGDLLPTTKVFGDSSIKYQTNNSKQLRISIRDGHNKLLNFPKSCSK